MGQLAKLPPIANRRGDQLTADRRFATAAQDGVLPHISGPQRLAADDLALRRAAGSSDAAGFFSPARLLRSASIMSIAGFGTGAAGARAAG